MASMAAISSADNSKSNTSMFSRMRAGVTDFGITISPLCKCQRSVIWAADLLCFLARSTMTFSLVTPPCAKGLQDSVAIPCLAWNARSSRCANPGCSSI
ncbi:hypothetical protein D3C71_1639740 [compost metagenome]